MPHDITPLVLAANAPLTDPELNRKIGTGSPRFELYHFALSLCSQKVRTCLAEKGASYIGHDLNLSMPLLGNYDPAYVRLRLAARPDATFATGYTGRSSVETEGFDPAVVPTLVDLEAGEVVVDSAVICRHIDTHVAPEHSLRPPELADTIDREIAIVDGTPHVAILYGAHPDHDFRPERQRKGMPGVHDRKIAKIRAARDSVSDDPALVAAYDAKIAKEEAARAFVATPDAMRQTVDEMLGIVAALDDRLADGRPFVCGDVFTLADVVWAVSLFRMKWIGMELAWTGGHPLNAIPRPNVAAYGTRAFDRPAFREAVIHWPGVARSEFVAEYYND
jgi:2,5-dichlorohydroquinone reductive dechlorinase